MIIVVSLVYVCESMQSDMRGHNSPPALLNISKPSSCWAKLSISTKLPFGSFGSVVDDSCVKKDESMEVLQRKQQIEKKSRQHSFIKP
jgi:hypothetical protein